MTAAIAAEIPALALVNAAGELERSTDAFRTRFGPAVEALEQEPRLDRVLSGQLEHSTLTLDGVAVEVEAVADARGARHALVMVMPNGSSKKKKDDAPNALLGEPLDDSPALAWLKDLE